MQKVIPRSEYLLTQGQECREAVLLCKGSVNIVANGVQADMSWFNLWKMHADPCKHANINMGEYTIGSIK